MNFDASGNRISKTANNKATIYVHDATGNVMSIYELSNPQRVFLQTHLYGSSRIGVQAVRTIEDETIPVSMTNNIKVTLSTITRAEKAFELSNHLGNVLVIVSDKKLQHTCSNTSLTVKINQLSAAGRLFPPAANSIFRPLLSPAILFHLKFSRLIIFCFFQLFYLLNGSFQFLSDLQLPFGYNIFLSNNFRFF